MNDVKFATYNTSYGKMNIYYKDGYILKIAFDEGKSSNDYNTISDLAYNEIDEYFSGKRKEFTIKYKISATEFEKKVYDRLSKIPYGSCKTYKDIAEEIHTKKSYRAVGNALSKNPLPIILPCHRVIKSNGTIGNYAFGKDMKKALLEMESKIKL